MKTKSKPMFVFTLCITLLIAGLFSPINKVTAAPANDNVGLICKLPAGASIHEAPVDDEIGRPVLYIKYARGFTITQQVEITTGKYLYEITADSNGFILRGWVDSFRCSSITTPQR